MNSLADNLPHELLINIFSSLNAADLANAGLVSKKWHDVSCDDSLWKNLFKDIPIEIGEDSFRNTLFQIKKITDYQQLIDDFKVFSESIKKNQDAYYDCIFLRNHDCFLNIEFGVIKDPKDMVSIEKQVLFTKDLPSEGWMAYGLGLDKRIQAKLTSKLSQEEIICSGDSEIISTIQSLYKQIDKTEHTLNTWNKTIAQIETIKTAVATGFVASIVFVLAYYKFN